MANKIPDGIYAATLTPLHEDLSCNIEKLANHCFQLLEKGCQGIALFGTTGEGSSFSVAERKEVLEELVARRFDPAKIILANGSAGIPDTVELARAALKYGCAAMLICPPCFYKNVSEEGVIAYYREIIRRTGAGLRMILYHIPQFSGVPITMRVIETLRREFPDIVIGIKESEGNLDFSKRILEAFPGFQVFVGNEKQIVETRPLGGSGSICGIANLYPELICGLYGERENPPKLEAIFQALQGYSFIPAAKSAMEKREGGHWHLVRPPLLPLGEDEANAFFRKLLRSIYTAPS